MTSPSTDTFSTKVFFGLDLLGRVFDKDPQVAGHAMSSVLMGQFATELRTVSYWQLKGQIPTSTDDLQQPEVEDHYQRMVGVVRGLVQGVFEEAARQDEIKRMNALQELKAKILQSNKPHEMGTVAELAAKYGKSKSEIRRLKAAGLLHTLTEEKTS